MRVEVGGGYGIGIGRHTAKRRVSHGWVVSNFVARSAMSEREASKQNISR